MRTLLALLIIFCLVVYWVDSTEPKTKETETIKKKRAANSNSILHSWSNKW
jgi:hypothetical protein